MSGNYRSNTRWTFKDIDRAKKQSAREKTSSSISVADFKTMNEANLLETDIQQDFMDLLAAIPYQRGTVKDFVYAIPNGGYRTKRTGKTLKAEGVKKGIPDTHCFIARAPYHSLYIEFKTEKGTLRPEQEQVIAMLREQGHKVVVCRSSQSGLTEILKYLGLSI